MQKRTGFNRALLDNLIWFAGAVALAFFVWVIATIQSNPIQQSRFPGQIPIQLTPDVGLLMVNASSSTASAVIRAPSATYDLLSADEITIWADLSGLGPGEHSVELQARLARAQASVIDISPSVIRVTLEEAAQRQIPLRAVMINEPPPGYAREEPVFDVNLNQVLVSGPASKVEEIVAAQVSLDLAEQRNPYEADQRLTPVDAEGSTVTGVTLDPQVVHVNVVVKRRDDVREVAIRPQLVGSLPDGYVLNALSYDPPTILVSGSSAQLDRLPDTLSTQPIELNNRTNSFEVSIPVVLPDRNLLVLSAQNITVTVEVTPLMSSRQFDNIPVEIIGLAEGHRALLAPDEVTVLLTGPLPGLEPLESSDIRVSIDLNGLVEGNYTVTPTVSISQGQILAENTSVLPAEIDVEIINAPLPPTSEPAP